MALIEVEMAAGERMTVDNYHLVTLSEQARYQVIKVGGMETTILSGEGLATEVTGPTRSTYRPRTCASLSTCWG